MIHRHTSKESHSGSPELQRTAALTLLSLSYMEKIAPGNPAFYKQMMRVFKSEALAFLIKVDEHLINRDWIGLAKISHAMKPTGSYMGNERLTLLIGTLEKAAHATDVRAINALLPSIRSMISKVNEEIDHYLYAA